MQHSASSSSLLEASLSPSDKFAPRHLGSNPAEIAEMIRALGLGSLNELIDRTVPEKIRLQEPMDLPRAKSESAALAELRAIERKNRVFRSFIGQGYHDTLVPGVIQRNILENPGWYTAY